MWAEYKHSSTVLDDVIKHFLLIYFGLSGDRHRAKQEIQPGKLRPKSPRLTVSQKWSWTPQRWNHIDRYSPRRRPLCWLLRLLLRWWLCWWLFQSQLLVLMLVISDPTKGLRLLVRNGLEGIFESGFGQVVDESVDGVEGGVESAVDPLRLERESVTSEIQPCLFIRISYYAHRCNVRTIPLRYNVFQGTKLFCT